MWRAWPRASRAGHRHRRPPAALGCPPVDRLAQHRELRRGELRGALAGQGPDEAAALEALEVEVGPVATEPQDLGRIATASSEDEDIAGVRCLADRLTHQGGEPRHALSHVGDAGGETDPHPDRRPDQEPSNRTSAAIRAGSRSVPTRSVACGRAIPGAAAALLVADGRFEAASETGTRLAVSDRGAGPLSAAAASRAARIHSNNVPQPASHRFEPGRSRRVTYLYAETPVIDLLARR